MYSGLEAAQATASSSEEEAGRGCRNKRKQSDPLCCPVCSCTLRCQELDSHFGLELDKLCKLNPGRGKRKSQSPSCSGPQQGDKMWDTYQKVRANRQARLKVKPRKRKADDASCPVCDKVVPADDMALHINLCLDALEGREEENIDVEGEDEADSTGKTNNSASNPGEEDADVDVDLVVDGDDTVIYGSPQYTEKDINVVASSEEKENREREALRRVILGGIKEPPAAKGRRSDENLSLEQNSMEAVDAAGEDKDLVIEALKSKVKELEERELYVEYPKCLICMSRYETPVVSICCWHVHCEQCWLTTLGAKKLCPQCNMITSPTDLRRVYM